MIKWDWWMKQTRVLTAELLRAFKISVCTKNLESRLKEHLKIFDFFNSKYLFSTFFNFEEFMYYRFSVFPLKTKLSLSLVLQSVMS